MRWASSMKEAIKMIGEEPADRMVVNVRAFKSQGGTLRQLPDGMASFLTFYNIRSMLLGQEYPYAQMSEALLALVSFVIRKALHDDRSQLEQIAATARYCKLLAMRLGLPVTVVDGAVLAAWLCAPGIGRASTRRCPAPIR